MAVTVKYHLYGSNERRSQEPLRSRAVIRFRADGIENTVEGLKEANQAAATGMLVHPNFDSSGIDALPLQEVESTRFGPEKAFGRMVFYRRRLGSFDIPELNVGRFTRSGDRYVEWFRSTQTAVDDATPTWDALGRPNGILLMPEELANDPDVPGPRAYELAMPAFRFTVPFVSGTAPANLGLVGTINDSQVVSFFGATFPTWTLLYNGSPYEIVQDSTGTWFSGFHDFRFCPQQWVSMVKFFNTDLDPDEWDTAIIPSRPEADFSTF